MNRTNVTRLRKIEAKRITTALSDMSDDNLNKRIAELKVALGIDDLDSWMREERQSHAVN